MVSWIMKPVKPVTVDAESAEDRDGFRFRGGCNAIDLPATLQARLSPSPRELLKTPEDLDRWLVSAGLASAGPKAVARDLVVAHTLREAIYALANGLQSGKEPRAARAALNRIAAGSAAVPQLRAYGSFGHDGTAAELLATLAREAVLLFGSAVAGQIRQCASPVCTLYFVDTSRRGDRRWCSMAACGNRAKLDGFRKRLRESEGEPE
jgi:predicted RNA-binding Zn ribbon-like protein